MLINCSSITGSVSGPNNGAMYARLPSIPSSSGGSESAHQNAACADSEKIESSQLFDKVRFVMCQMWWRETGGWSVMTSPAFLKKCRPAQIGRLMD